MWEVSYLNTCKFCGKTFERKNPQQIYCSRNCSNEANKQKYREKKKTIIEIRQCAFCGNDFEWTSSKPGQKYCSRECSNNANKYIPKTFLKEIRQCAHCGSDFEWKSSNPGQKYCSKECSSNATKSKLPKKEIIQEIHQCAICGSDFTWFSNKSNQKYCSDECRKIAAKAQIKSYNKSNTIDEDELVIKASVELKVTELINRAGVGKTFNGQMIDYWDIGNIPEAIKTAVLSRDKHRCQVCMRDYGLHIHHIIKRRNGGDHSLENLVTLCSSCHRHIETCDIDHAVSKCLKNAKKFYYNDGIEQKQQDRNYNLLVAKSQLERLFDELKETKCNKSSLSKITDVIDDLELLVSK